jgi:hypothetical protein
MRENCEAWFKKNNQPLPKPREVEHIVLSRDFSHYEIEADDADNLKKQKEEKGERARMVFDFYVDCLLPAAAGSRVWNVYARHCEPISTCKQATSDKLRITAATEAMCLTMYHNGRNKWNAQFEFRKTNEKGPFPKFNPKDPEVNKEFSTPFCSANGGTSKFGGWNETGRQWYAKTQKALHQARSENKERFIQAEKESCKRLKAANAELHTKDYLPKPKKRKSDEIAEEDHSAYDFFLEL